VKTTKLISIIAAVMLGACGQSQTADEYIELAKQEIQKKELHASIINLKNAIKTAPDNAQARYILGDVYLALGNSRNAIKELEKARELKYQSDNLIARLARAYYLNQESDLLNSLWQEQGPDKKEVYAEVGAYLVALLIIEGAEHQEVLNAIENQYPNQFFTQLASAYNDYSQKNLSGLQNKVNGLLSQRPKNPELILLSAQMYSLENDAAKAAEYYKTYLDLQPEQGHIALLLADSLINANNIEEAKVYLQQILAAAPKQPMANYLMARVKFVEKDYQGAFTAGQTAIDAGLKNLYLTLLMGASSFYEGNFESSYRYLNEVAKYTIKGHPARKMLIISQLKLGLMDEMSTELQQFDVSNEVDQTFLTSLSINLHNLGATLEAQKIANKVNEVDNKSINQKYTSGVMKLMLNDSSAVNNFKEVLDTNIDYPNIELMLSLASLKNNELDQAIAYADEWISKNVEKPKGYLLKGNIYMAKEAFEEAELAFSKALELEENNQHALIGMIKIALKRQDLATAETLVDKAILVHPNSTKVLGYNYIIKRNEKSKALIKSAYDESSDSAAHTVLYAKMLVVQGEYNEAWKVVSTLNSTIDTPFEGWLLKVAIAHKLNDKFSLEKIATEWIKANPYHVQPVLLKAELALMERDPEAALKTVESALNGQLNNNNELKMIKLELLLQLRKVSQAKKYLETLLQQEDEAERFVEAIGRVALLEKDYSKAAKYLLKSFNNSPTRRNAVLLSVAYKENDELQKAIDILTSYEKTQENDIVVKNALASMLLITDKKEALEKYHQIIELKPNDLVALNNAAWLHIEQGDYEQAHKFAKVALSIDEENFNVLDTYAQSLVKLERTKEALQYSKKAFEKSNGSNPDVSINYAELLFLNNRKSRAKEILESVTPLSESQTSKISQLINKYQG